MRATSAEVIDDLPVKSGGKLIVVVLGMHRSGTSAVTRGLTVLGVELGDRLMPPKENINDRGFFEDIDINAINVRYIALSGRVSVGIRSSRCQQANFSVKRMPLSGSRQLNCLNRDWKT